MTLNYYVKNGENRGYKILAIVKTKAKTYEGMLKAVNKQTDFNMDIEEFEAEINAGFVNFCADGIVFLYD